MKDLPLSALRAFAMVYATGGIRTAARQLGVAHSSVSRHLRELDTWLGVPLTRSAGGRPRLVLTPQGETLGKATLAGLKNIELVVSALREARSAGSVTISTTASFAARWLLPRLPALETAHPKVEVSVLVDQTLSNLDSGHQDFAIRMGHGPWPDLDCEPLMNDALYPVMSPSLWRSVGRPDQPGGLVRLRLLHDRDPQTAWMKWKNAFGPASLNARKGPRFASSDILLRAAAQGQGVALARHRLVCDDVDAGLLVRPIENASVALGPSYWIVKSRHMAPRPEIEAVLAWLKGEAKNEEPDSSTTTRQA